MPEIFYYRNDTQPIRVTIRDRKTLAPLDVTGKNFLLTVDPVENPTSSAANLVQLTGAIEDAAGGIVAFTPGATDMDFAPGDYWFDIQMDDGGNVNRRTIIKDRFYHKQDITK